MHDTPSHNPRTRPDSNKKRNFLTKNRQFSNQNSAKKGAIGGQIQHEQKANTLRCNDLQNYGTPKPSAVASAELGRSRVPAFHIGKHINDKNTGERLKETLGEYGIAMTGRVGFTGTFLRAG